jgi:hypothetical protein
MSESFNLRHKEREYMGATIHYTISTHVCPHCNNKLIGGQRRFGPAQVRCGHCDAVLQTGLDEWADLSTTRRISAAIEEIVLPSWIGAAGCTGLLLKALTQLFLWAVVPSPLYFIAMILDPNMQSIATVLLFIVVGPLVYPALLAVRLVRMIRESQAHTRRGEIPVWGKEVAKAQAQERAVAGRYLDKRYRILLRLLALALAAAWFELFSIFLRSTPLLTAGLTANSQLAGIALVLVHTGGAVVVAELLRCLGNDKKGAYAIAVLTLLFAPIALPIAALLTRHRVSGLIKTIKNSNASIRRGRATETEFRAHTEAWQALADVRNPTAVEPLTQALRDRDADVRQAAASVLGEIGDKRAVASLIQALKDKDGRVHAAAATALGKIGDTQAIEPLNAALKDESDSVRSAAAQALDTIAGKAKA